MDERRPGRRGADISLKTPSPMTPHQISNHGFGTLRRRADAIVVVSARLRSRGPVRLSAIDYASHVEAAPD